MSSHREAPEIAKDPAADNTDVYAFMHPTKSDRVVIIANFIPLQQPNGGPNFYEFADDVLYTINVSNTSKMEPDVSFEFRFKTAIRNPNTFLYNTGPIDTVSSANWNRPQTYTVTRVEKGGFSKVMGKDLSVPPVNVGVRSTPDYAKLSAQAVHQTGGSFKVFAGQRADAFHVDLGSVFDLGALRPFNHLHLISQPDTTGVNAVQAYNVHTIAIQVPSRLLTSNGKPATDPNSRQSVVGVWATASRQTARTFNRKAGKYVGKGAFKQVSRLGSPLFNEVIVPMAEKDSWNTSQPADDATYASYVNHPELAGLLPVLYPGVFPNLKAYTKPRADLAAILLTGIPKGVVPGFQNYTGPVQADMLRLNMAIPATKPGSENALGIVGGDLAGFPNGRRVGDDVVAIELKAIAGATIPLVDPSFTPDDAAAALNDGTSTADNAKPTDEFPFLNLPGGGYETVPGTTSASAS